MSNAKRVAHVQDLIVTTFDSLFPLSRIGLFHLEEVSSVMANSIVHLEQFAGSKLDDATAVNAAKEVAEAVLVLQDPVTAMILSYYRDHADEYLGGRIDEHRTRTPDINASLMQSIKRRNGRKY